FFVSSGSRHTRWPRDWSSDVCSSDLSLLLASAHLLVVLTLSPSRKRISAIRPLVFDATAESSPSIRPLKATRLSGIPGVAKTRRSEERRVGKEGEHRKSTDTRQEKLK